MAKRRKTSLRTRAKKPPVSTIIEPEQLEFPEEDLETASDEPIEEEPPKEPKALPKKAKTKREIVEVFMVVYRGVDGRENPQPQYASLSQEDRDATWEGMQHSRRHHQLNKTVDINQEAKNFIFSLDAYQRLLLEHYFDVKLSLDT